jgi:hypothetical protein
MVLLGGNRYADRRLSSKQKNAVSVSDNPRPPLSQVLIFLPTVTRAAQSNPPNLQQISQYQKQRPIPIVEVCPSI